MRPSEWIAAGYFLYLLLPIVRSPQRRTVRLTLAGGVVAMILGVLWIGATSDSRNWRIARNWAPGVYLLAGYWLSGQLYTDPNLGVERLLLAIDARLGASVSRAARIHVDPRIKWLLRAYLELTYLSCYVLVPLAFGIVSRFGAADPALTADRFWRVVLLAVFACYGALPWVPTRPPRALVDTGQQMPLSPEPAAVHHTSHVQVLPETTAIRRLNLLVLRHASIQVNTFPSGHVAAATAAALAAGRVLPAAGAALGVLALSIAAASVLGRYHYFADALLGAVAAFAAFAALG